MFKGSTDIVFQWYERGVFQWQESYHSSAEAASWELLEWQLAFGVRFVHDRSDIQQVTFALEDGISLFVAW